MEYLIYTGLCSIAFISIYTLAHKTNRRPWRKPDSAVVFWGLLFSAAAGWFWVLPILLLRDAPESMTLQFLGLVIAIGIPGSITALLVGRALKDRRACYGVLAATVLAMAAMAGLGDARYFLAPIAWNAVVGWTVFRFGPRYAVDPSPFRPAD